MRKKEKSIEELLEYLLAVPISETDLSPRAKKKIAQALKQNEEFKKFIWGV